MPYIYEGHMGGIYCSDEQIDHDLLYCEICGDSDHLIGCFSTVEEVLTYMADDIDARDGWGGWSIEMVLKDLSKHFDCIPTLKEAIKIVLGNRSPEEDY